MLRCAFLCVSNWWLCRWPRGVVQRGQSEKPFADTTEMLGEQRWSFTASCGVWCEADFVLPVKGSQRLLRNKVVDSEDSRIVTGDLCGCIRLKLSWAMEQVSSKHEERHRSYHGERKVGPGNVKLPSCLLLPLLSCIYC